MSLEELFRLLETQQDQLDDLRRLAELHQKLIERLVANNEDLRRRLAAEDA